MFEKVNPSHPDKVADRIAGAIVDLCYTKSRNRWSNESSAKLDLSTAEGRQRCAQAIAMSIMQQALKGDIAAVSFIRNFLRQTDPQEAEQRKREAADTHGQIAECERAISLISSYGYKGEFFLYTMLNSNFSESYSRVRYWWERLQQNRKDRKTGDVYAYAQPYRNPTKNEYPPNGNLTWQCG